MSTLDIRIELPEDADVTPQQKDSAEAAAREAIILDLYSSRVIGGYHAARLLNMDYYDFLDLLSKKGIPASMTESQPQHVREVNERFGKTPQTKAC